MTSIRTEALILRSVDFGESDRILHLLVPEIGRLPVIAKGARRSVRRFSGTLDLFNHVKIQVDLRRPTVLARLDQASLIDPFIAMRSETARFALGCYLLELFDRLAPERGVRADTQRLFSFALGALRMVADRDPDLRLRTLIELRALDALGLRPEFSRCVRCGSTPEGRGPIAFHVADGGVVCDRCCAQLDGILRVQPGTLRALDRGLRLDFELLDRLAMSGALLAEARQLLGRFQRFHLGVELRSAPYLDRVLRSPAPR
ncbi:MAG: DNA repair protein RecO [Myxococcales bacterium]|nr:DNA repair protein RecO [Myxococcales bacterium]